MILLIRLFQIFVDELNIKIKKEQIHKFAVDYISYFDIIESINIYNFLEAYHLNHSFYDLAEREFQELLGVA